MQAVAYRVNPSTHYNCFSRPSAEVADVERIHAHRALSSLVASVRLSVHRFYSGTPLEYPSRPAVDVAGHSPQQPALCPVSPAHNRHRMQNFP